MGRTIGVITTPQLGELVDLIEKNFITFNKTVQPIAGQMYITKSIPLHQGNSKRIDEFDFEQYAKEKREGANVSKSSVGIGYSKTITKKRIGIEIDITQEMLDEAKDEQISSKIRSINHFCPNRHELDLTHRFTFANAVSYTDMDGNTVAITTGDGLALAYSAHTLKHSSITYRNRVSGDPVFSKGAFQAARLLANTNILSDILFGCKENYRCNNNNSYYYHNIFINRFTFIFLHSCLHCCLNN